MRGFEVVVRPVVFPNIRPGPTRSLAPDEDPEKGLVVLGGSGGGLIGLTYSESLSWSKSKQTEVKRRFDVQRVHQKEKDGTINKENFVEVERTNKIVMRDDATGVEETQHFAKDPYPADNIETIQKNITTINVEGGKVTDFPGGGGP